MGFVRFTGLLLQLRAYGEAPDGVRRALWCWAQKRTEWCERRGLRKTAIGAYILRLGASITLEDAHNGLLELIRSTTRGMAVRDMTIDTEGY